ncbi:MAG: SRPBCC family protein [Candidatus Sericytochromatia bacterium]
MPTFFKLTPSELDFAAKAPYCLDNQTLIEAPPEQVFAVLSESDWHDWFVDFKSVEWTSPAPYGVGSTRTVVLKTLTVQERFLAWEPGRRFSFSIDAISLPLVKWMMEDMHLEPVENGRATRFRWRVYYAPAPLMQMAHPIARGIFGGMFKASLNNLKAYAEKKVTVNR